MRNGYYGESADCGECGRRVKVHMPKDGDTSARMTYWHKDKRTGRWCRSVVDVLDVHQAA